MSDFASSVYDDASDLGVIQSFIGLIFAVVIGLILVIIGYYFVFSTNEYIKTSGEIIFIECENIITNKTTGTRGTNKTTKTTKQCTLEIKYFDSANNSYTNSIIVNDKNYSLNQKINIEYLKSDPNQIRIPGLSDQVLGYISSGISLLIIAGAGINYYFASNYKLYASAQGAKTVYNVFK